MKTLFSVLFVVIIIACGGKKDPDVTPIVIPPPVDPTPTTPTFELPKPADCGYQQTATDTQGWNLVFEDNFDKTLDNWTIWRGGAFNNELQFYQSNNLILKDGYLFIHAKKENATGPTTPFDNTQKQFTYTSGRMESKRTFGATRTKSYKIATRIQLVKGEGLWPAFWTYNDPWPTKGEIDIMEYRGGAPDKFQSVYHFGRGSNLETDANKNNFYYQLPAGAKDFATCFYIFELEWFDGKLDIKLDGKLVKTFKEPENPFINQFTDKPHRVILNLAVGGDFFQNLDRTKIPANGVVMVDWVRVYDK